MQNRPYLSPTSRKRDHRIDSVADSGTVRQLGKPGKRALCTEPGKGVSRENREKPAGTPQANKNVADSYVPGVLLVVP